MVWARSHRVLKSKDRLNPTNLKCGLIKIPEWQFRCGYLSVACRILFLGVFSLIESVLHPGPSIKNHAFSLLRSYSEVFCSGFGGSVEVICSSNITARLIQVLEMGNWGGVWSGRKYLEFLKRKTPWTTSFPSTTRPRRPSSHQASASASVFPYHGYVLITYELFFVLTCFVSSYTARTSTIRRERNAIVLSMLHIHNFQIRGETVCGQWNCLRVTLDFDSSMPARKSLGSILIHQALNCSHIDFGTKMCRESLNP